MFYENLNVGENALHPKSEFPDLANKLTQYIIIIVKER